jgi:hypothetical protein
VLSHFLTIMGELASHCDPLPPVLLDAVLLQLTPEQHNANAAGTRLALQLIHKYPQAFERPIFNFLNETLVQPPEEGQTQTIKRHTRATRSAHSGFAASFLV